MTELAGAGSGIRSVLILEDEGLVSLLMEDIIRDMGVSSVDVFADVPSALEAARTGDYDCAVLDLFVGTELSLPVADLLVERGIPFVFATGSTPDAIAGDYARRPVLIKPFGDNDLRTQLLALAVA